ncbi:hypothetical protein SAMN05216431_10318 [Ligilactobacillus sp. WC1T17]|uniref:Uncharacterized protein n=1 Tax=Ligilactobacillus ruminis TaxID=1623 RepID=A0ABY1AA09_9LACO|nr:hypothetical protein SAMN05216431_10318 [Ligilactobacillus ruminis]
MGFLGTLLVIWLISYFIGDIVEGCCSLLPIICVIYVIYKVISLFN